MLALVTAFSLITRSYPAYAVVRGGDEEEMRKSDCKAALSDFITLTGDCSRRLPKNGSVEVIDARVCVAVIAVHHCASYFVIT